MATDAKPIELLRNVDVFASLNTKELAALARIAQHESHKPGEIVIRQGDSSDSFQIVAAGTYDVFLWDDLLKIERPLTLLRRGDIFGEMGLLTDESRSAFVRAKQEGETLIFNRKSFYGLLAEQPGVLLALAKTLAHRLSAANRARGINLDKLANYEIPRELVQLLPLQVILRHNVLVVAKDQSEITVATVDPSNLIARNSVTEFLGKFHIRWICISQPDFENFRDRKLFELVNDTIQVEEERPTEITYVTSKNAGPALEATSAPGRLLDTLLRSAIDAAASDLHLEPSPNGVAVRARIDGHLVELAPALTLSEYRPIASRIKVLSDLDITETRLPQDSVLRLQYGRRNIDLRISTMPTPRGEAVACRLFDPLQRKLDLKNLIVSEQVADMVKHLFYLPSGLVLVTGPTGSGKTTTLYAGLQKRLEHNPTQKLVTAEDPIEYELHGATQVQVLPHIGLTWDRILRSLLRQDPDIMLVGEIRDKASMEIALEAALTGHFVLSSLHTNGGFETIMRLRQRGTEPYVIATALRGVISQRLAPRLCDACAEETTPDKYLLQQLRASEIIGPKQTPNIWRALGCNHCRMSGVKGRIGLYELLCMTPELRDGIERNVTLATLEKLAPPASHVSMRRYARFLMEKGLLSPAAILEIFPPASEADRKLK